MICPLKMVIFHGYVKSSEGTYNIHMIIPLLFHMAHNPMIVPLFSRYLPWFSKLAKPATYVFQLLDIEKIQQTPSIFTHHF